LIKKLTSLAMEAAVGNGVAHNPWKRYVHCSVHPV